MQLIFKETKEGGGDAVVKRRQKTVIEDVPYSDHELFRETERDLKPWQRYFRNVFHQRGIKSRPSSNHQKIGQFQQQRLSGRPPPPTLQRPQRRQQSNSQIQDSLPLRSLPFSTSSPVPASARGANKDPHQRALLPLGLVPPSHPITQVLPGVPASARVLGVSPAKVGHQHHNHVHGGNVPPRAQTAVMSLDAFLREFPDTKRMKTIPVEVSGRESDVVARLASGERDRELVAELDDLIAARAERKIGHTSTAVDHHRGEAESGVTVRPRGGNEPFFFSSDGGLSNSIDGAAVAPTFTQEFATTPRSRSPLEQRRQQNYLPEQQRYHELSFVREPDLEFGFRPLQDNPFFFTTTEKPRQVKDQRDGRGGRGSRQHLRQRHRHAVESNIEVGFRDISAVAADAVRKVKATQFDMRNLFFIPPERGKSTRNNRGRNKKKRKNAGHGFFTP